MNANVGAVKAQVTYQFKSSPEAVFNAWITGDKVRKWFAPGLGEMTRIAIEPRVGGSFLFAQRRGMDDVEHVGKYLELDRPNRLAFTWGVKGTGTESRVLIDIVPSGDGSELKLTHELAPFWENYRERTEAAWMKMLNAMAEALA